MCVFKTALTFVDSVSEIWGPLIKGLSLVVVPKTLTKDPEKLIDLLDEYKVIMPVHGSLDLNIILKKLQNKKIKFLP